MTTRIEQIGDATLYLGDAREIVSGLSPTDLLLTDPVWPNCPPGLLPGHENPYALLNDVAYAMQTPRRAVIVMRSDSDPRFLGALPGWRFVCMQALAYAVPMYLGRVLGGTEIAYAFGEPPPVRPGMKVIPMWGPKAQPTDRPPNGHPCSRALVHQDWLVHWWSLRGETVLDPFMGSGTAGVAAIRARRRFIGIEIEPRYFDIACERIERAHSEIGLDLGEPQPCEAA